MRKIVYDDREYEVEDTENKYKLKDVSNSEIKIHMNFSKNPKDHEEAKKGWELFWAEVL